MVQFFKNVNIDWLANRRLFIVISLLLMLAGLASAVIRQATGHDPFNLGVDFKGGTEVTARFKQRPSAEAISAALAKTGVKDAVVQPVLSKADETLIRLPQQAMPAANAGAPGEEQAQVDPGRVKVKQALDSFGAEAKGDLNADAQAAYKIERTEAVGPVAGRQLRNQAITVTLLALVGILAFIAFRFEWTYGAAAVIAVFHDVLVTLGIFSIMQWEISLTVIAALLTIVGFSVNDSIVTFDRIRENLRLHRRDSLYKITNDSINQTLSRTIITSGLVLLSVIALVLFGGEVLRGFSLALLIGVGFGTYSSIAIASPIMVWWQQRLDVNKARTLPPAAMNKRGTERTASRAGQARVGGVVNEPQGAARS
ncbi:MAG: protein translocase subunit SecF [Pyrinomonadaceae bacterium]